MYTCLKCYDLVDKNYQRKCSEYRLCSYCWRNAKQRWKHAIKRGHNVPIELYIKNSRVQIVRAKGDTSYHNAKQFCYRALAMPKWVNIEAISEFYNNCPSGYHVDHIVPIRGKTISGLHVIWNLQYLPANENIKKKNKFT